MTKLDNIEHNIKNIPTGISSFFEWYFTLTGRIGRVSFFRGSIILVIIEKMITGNIEYTWENNLYWSWNESLFLLLALIFLAVRLPLIVKRLHDIGLSGYFALLWLTSLMFEWPFVAVVILIFYLVLFIYPGNSTKNKYGEALVKKKHK